jgi:2-polyprenylphenol 6-hydroxylase
MISITTLKTDVTIVGAGLVGLAAALALDQAGYNVILVDSQLPQQSNGGSDDWDQRIYTISPKNVQWLTNLGAWQLLDKGRVAEMQAMEIWGDDSVEPLRLLAEDANADDLGFIVEERALKNALCQCMQASGVRTMYGEVCDALQTTAQHTLLQLRNQQAIESSLLLAADGANSWIRQQLGVGVQQKPYHQTAIVANFLIEKSHNNIARQWFTQDADGSCGILAWLPLPENKVSIVWSASTQYAETLLKLSADEFTRQVMAVGSSMLGKFELMAEPAGFPLMLKTANHIIHNAVVLIGDAAHRIHPMAGQGVNLGFRDVIDLLSLLTKRHKYQSINDAALLKHYERVRKADLLNMTMLTNGLYHLFDSQSKVLKILRNKGLLASSQHVIKKKLVLNAITL